MIITTLGDHSNTHKMKPIASHVVLDIEGTTCPVDFVAEVLFPFAREHLQRFICNHTEDKVVAILLGEAEAAWLNDRDPQAIALRQTLHSTNTGAGPEQIAAYLDHLISVDRKLTVLKELQGMIWAEGYASQQLYAPLFDEVGTTLSSWKGKGVTLAVYSSGSVAAQQLLYRYSSAGDLRELFSAWFDTRIGSKTEAQSYLSIASALRIAPGEALFISDSVGELDAAHNAGFQVCFSNRDGNPNRDPGPHPSITSLRQIDPTPPTA